MSLGEYRSKRDLNKSKEPSAGKNKRSDALNFCIQKHAARRLHYDFRLEYKGVLLSWAVPKGPSLDPYDKRLAIQVEDHPLDYQYFEGTIPKGNYGAGKVEIWDRGTYTVPHVTTREEIEKYLTIGLKKGHFAVILHGEKLQGEFVFQKLKQDAEDTAWLLIKKEDAFATETDHDKPAKQVKMPEFVTPMLATLADHPFSSEDWLFEIKWDGYRALAFIDPNNVQLKSRNRILLNDRFPVIVDSLKKVKDKVIFDGELVVLDSAGKSDFQLMQNYQKDHAGVLYYYVFDLLYKDGQDLRNLPLIERKNLLKKLLKELNLPLIRYSDHIVKDGEDFYKEAVKNKLEGIIGKKVTSTYQSRRSQDWVKIKTALRQEVVIGGFTEPRGSRKKFGALLVGVYDDQGELHYVGHVGGGFTDELLEDVYKQLLPLSQKKSPFKNIPKPNMPVTWIKPKLVCEVSFAEWTKDDIMRQPIFRGLRIDKNPKEVKKEIPTASEEKKGRTSKRQELELTNLDKLYWPKEKYTKGDLIAYYQKVAPYLLPYLRNRPITLHRFPDGIEGKDFYQKNIDFSHPDWLKTFPVQHEGKVDHYLMISDLRSLLYAVNLGSIDLHPFTSRCKNLEKPDYCIIDLDPHDIAFEKVIEIASATHELLERAKIKNYCKTSGGKGLHIFIPLHAKYDYEQSKEFAHVIALCIHKQFPTITSVERSPQSRPKKIYLDYLQNRALQTIVAPYSVRPRPGALVSTPLLWEEVKPGLDPKDFDIHTILKRLDKMGDIFKPILGGGVNMQTALNRLKKMFI
ncbi:putative DNA ligase-like protein Rv0938/MT0965 [Parachlamydia acanthamoebae UV-7]|uniref:DNA ligase (ATP) n=2 Tax=Parachlamydia acanthamoebae TaxID=83552 RepID=F8KYR4_PARAV|nr:DNA ligase D [Parachlamydia acanthamoebae]KIA78239.1 putative DNA ligase-like protein [Parachlamydia acanthamoebae]CCB86019.1 putative DNA ligase-like protein Rv0938/MT0965 [Parachlamydia acanthamoebae UV-7]